MCHTPSWHLLFNINRDVQNHLISWTKDRLQTSRLSVSVSLNIKTHQPSRPLRIRCPCPLVQVWIGNAAKSGAALDGVQQQCPFLPSLYLDLFPFPHAASITLHFSLLFPSRPKKKFGLEHSRALYSETSPTRRRVPGCSSVLCLVWLNKHTFLFLCKQQNLLRYLKPAPDGWSPPQVFKQWNLPLVLWHVFNYILRWVLTVFWLVSV